MAGHHRAYPAEFRQRTLERVRAVGADDLELGEAGRLGQGTARRRADDRREGRGAALAAGEPPASRGARDSKKSRGLVCSGDRIDPTEGFGFVRAKQAEHPVATMCRVLEVSTSGYYAWVKREPSKRA